MERKILRKRKGQWVTASVALLALGLVAAENVHAQEVAEEPATVASEEATTVETVSAEASPASTSPVSHTVVSNDTLYSIARKNNVSVAQLQEWNKLSDSNIYVGQVLSLQGAQTPAPAVVTTTAPVSTTVTEITEVTEEVATISNVLTSGEHHSNIGQRDLLKYIIAAEAGTTNVEGINAVTSVIFNRADVQKKTPIEIVTAKQQFIVYAICK